MPKRPYVYDTRPCVSCHTIFQATSAHHIYCSEACRSPIAETWDATYNCVCPTCATTFTAKSRSKKYCSIKCRPSYAYMTPKVDFRVSSSTMGAMAELAVSIDLMKHGYSVFRAISPDNYCDLIAKKDGSILEIEVRTAYQRHGRHYFPPYSKEGVNCFGLWDKETQTVSYLSAMTLAPIAI